MTLAKRPDLLPVLNAIQRGRASVLARLREIRDSLRPRVLIADDNVGFAELLRLTLEERGVVADVAHTEAEVRQALFAARYALVLVDGCMLDGGDETPAMLISADPEASLHARVDRPYVSKMEGAAAVADAALAALEVH